MEFYHLILHAVVDSSIVFLIFLNPCKSSLPWNEKGAKVSLELECEYTVDHLKTIKDLFFLILMLYTNGTCCLLKWNTGGPCILPPPKICI